MCNFRETKEKIDCTYCKHFYSYQASCEDDLEPCEYGICSNVDDTVGEGMICDLFLNTVLNTL